MRLIFGGAASPAARPGSGKPCRTGATEDRLRRVARFGFPRAGWTVLAGVAACLSAAGSAAAVVPGAPILEERIEEFSSEAYHSAVERAVTAFEQEREEKLAPGERGQVGLKIYTNSGPGLATPVPLVRAVIAALVERGFSPEKIFLVDTNENRLRQAGYLPSLNDGGTTFEGHPVHVLESGEHYNNVWFYDSPLPPRREAPRTAHRRGEFSFEPSRENRRSYLPKPLLLEVDFWINLPVYSDHPVLGVNGALVNATLWNASNTGRFFHSKASGPAAVAEIAAVPELSERWLFSLVSLERYQFVGGPAFRSLYTASEPVLLLSADPVALDSRMYRKINERREARDFEPLEEGYALLDYARQLNLGRPEPAAGAARFTGPYREGRGKPDEKEEPER